MERTEFSAKDPFSPCVSAPFVLRCSSLLTNDNIRGDIRAQTNLSRVPSKAGASARYTDSVQL
jgi:hypothetical protein